VALDAAVNVANCATAWSCWWPSTFATSMFAKACVSELQRPSGQLNSRMRLPSGSVVSASRSPSGSRAGWLTFEPAAFSRVHRAGRAGPLKARADPPRGPARRIPGDERQPRLARFEQGVAVIDHAHQHSQAQRLTVPAQHFDPLGGAHFDTIESRRVAANC